MTDYTRSSHLHHKTLQKWTRLSQRCRGACSQQKCSHILISSRFKTVSGYTGISMNAEVRENLSCNKKFDCGFLNDLQPQASLLIVCWVTRTKQCASLFFFQCLFGKMGLIIPISEFLWKVSTLRNAKGLLNCQFLRWVSPTPFWY